MDVGKSIAVAVPKGEESEEREGSGFSWGGGWRMTGSAPAVLDVASSFAEHEIGRGSRERDSSRLQETRGASRFLNLDIRSRGVHFFGPLKCSIFGAPTGSILD